MTEHFLELPVADGVALHNVPQQNIQDFGLLACMLQASLVRRLMLRCSG